MAEKHPDFWKIKAAFAESRAAVLAARLEAATASAKLGVVMRAAGLDPSADYRLDDATETIELIRRDGLHGATQKKAQNRVR